MNDKNLHINQQSSGGYPKPDIPVDEAWANMDAMLTAQAPPPPSGGAMGRFWKPFLGAIVVSGVLFLGVYKLSKKSSAPILDNPKNITTATQLTMDSTATTTASVKEDIANKNSISTDTLLKNDSTISIQNKQNDVANISAPSHNNDNNNLAKTENNQDKPSNNNIIKPSKKTEITSANKYNNKNITRPVADDKLNNNRLKNNETEKLVVTENKELQNEGRKTNDKLSGLADTNITKVIVAENKSINNLPPNNNEAIFSKNEKVATVKNIRPTHQMFTTRLSTSNSIIGLKELLLKQNNLNKVSKNRLPKKNKSNNTNFISDVSYGLQLNATIPLQNECLCNYGLDANGKKQAWKLLVPGIWASKIFAQKHEVTLQFNPYRQYFVSSKPVSVESFYLPPELPEDTLLANKSINIVKTRGLSAGVQYNYHFSNKWSAGVGADYNTQSQTLLNEQVTRVYDGKLLLYKVYGSKTRGDSVQYLKPYFITSNFNVMYSFKKLQIGARLQIPVTNLALPKNDAIRPVNGQLFFRWRFR